MRGAPSSVSRDKQTPPLSAITILHRRNIDNTRRSSSNRYQSQILVVENHDFCLPHLHSTPSLEGSRRNIVTGVTPIGQGWTNASGLRGLGGSEHEPNFLYILMFQVLGVRHLFYFYSTDYS